MKKIWVLLFLAIISLTAYSENSESDSLLSIIKQKKEGEPLVGAYHQFVKINYRTSPDECIEYLKESNRVSKKIKYKKGIYESLSLVGLIKRNEGLYDTALHYFERALVLSKEAGDQEVELDVLNKIGTVYYFKGDFNKAIEFYNRTLLVIRAKKDAILEAKILNNMALIHEQRGDYNNALKLHFKSLKLKELLKDTANILISYSNIGIVYLSREQLNKAWYYFEKTEQLSKRFGGKENQANALNNKGIIMYKKDKKDSTIYYYKAAHKLFVEMGNSYKITNSLNNIGTYFYESKIQDSALFYLSKALEIARESEDVVSETRILLNLSMVYVEINQPEKALKFGNSALVNAREQGMINELSNIYMVLAQAHEKSKNIPQSYECYKLFISYRDSLFNESKSQEIGRIESEYEFQKKSLADSLEFVGKQKIQQAEIASQQAQLKSERTIKTALVSILALLAVFSLVVYNRFKVTQKQKIIIEHQKDEVEEKNQEILDSITYAKRLQDAILPPLKVVKQNLENSFILYKPKDIVAGDFYWMELASVAEALEAQKQDRVSISGTSRASVTDIVLFAAADCTGHGVPGAMVSVVCSNALNRAVKEFGIIEPGRILDKVTDLVIETFEKSEAEVKDGMDISLCSIKYQVEGIKTKTILQWAGANNPLWIVRAPRLRSATEQPHYSLEEVKADKQPIGKYSERHPFTTHSIELNEGDSIYIFTDGYADQFGGEKGKKYKSSRMKEHLLSIQAQSMDKQKQLINEAFENWKGELEQIDDVCIIGVRI